MRPIRVVIRTSRTDSAPYAGSAVMGHFRTVAADHGANARMSTSECGWMLRVHCSAAVSAFMTVTVRTVCGICACHSLFPRADIFVAGAVSAMRAVSRRDGAVTCHPSAPVTGSAQGVSRPLRPARAVVPSSRPFVPACPLRADTREGGTKGRSLTVTLFGEAGAPPAPADLVGAAFADEVAQVPVERGARHSGEGYQLADFPSFLGRGAQRVP